VISYYRLSAYCLPFQEADSDHTFRPGATFDDVLTLYVFDRQLRLLILDAIERIEVAFRARMTQVLGEHHGSHAYTAADIFDDRYNHDWLLKQVEDKCCSVQAETFIRHYREKYRSPSLPPIWMVMEILTFKEVSVLFSKLCLKEDKQAISRFWGLPDAVLRSWFREFGSRPMVPKKPPTPWPDLSPMPKTGIDPTRRLYYLLVVIEYLLRRINPGSSWHRRLFALMEKYPNVSREHMGMPENWYGERFWHLGEVTA
jgi:abortive infection bacteriophage resistance protein